MDGKMRESKLDPKILAEIEPKIRAVVTELNALGQKTVMSCQGHKDQGSVSGIRPDGSYIHSKGRGWISFYQKGFNETIARKIMIKHKLKRIRFFTIPDKKGIIFSNFTMM
jgi:hypothetical protein